MHLPSDLHFFTTEKKWKKKRVKFFGLDLDLVVKRVGMMAQA
jgi:hypothetical protein